VQERKKRLDAKKKEKKALQAYRQKQQESSE
jgi:hypothetical protein